MVATIGIDIGQSHDPTALTVCEPEYRTAPDFVHNHQDVHWTCRWLERLPLNIPYPKIAERLATVAYNATYHSGHLEVFVDATGVGKPVVDILVDALRDVDARIRPVYFTHGDKRVEDHLSVRLGKAYLVSRLRALLETRRLHLPRMVHTKDGPRAEESQALVAELLNYEIKIGPDADERYGAFKVGTHDDLVTALGLATNVDPIGTEMLL